MTSVGFRGLLFRSLPSRGRGLKFPYDGACSLVAIVAPFTGAWIEIGIVTLIVCTYLVAPFTGAWIEIGASGATMVATLCRSLHGGVD